MIAGDHPADEPFNFAGHLGKGRSTVSARKLQAAILGGIVAGGDVNSSVQAAVEDFVGKCRSRIRASGDAGFGPVRVQDFSGDIGEFFREEPGVVSDDDVGAG